MTPTCNPSPTEVLAAMRRRLPGRLAQFWMATLPRSFPNRRPPRDAAVLLLLHPGDGGLNVLLTLLSHDVAAHAGQISLPGGARENGEPLIETALREAAEEVGLSPGCLDIIGALTPLPVPSSNYLIYPFIALARYEVTCHPITSEVAEVFDAPLSLLVDPAARQEENWNIGGSVFRVRFFRIGDRAVWGATAMILSELVWLLCPPGTHTVEQAARAFKAGRWSAGLGGAEPPQ